MHATMNTPNTDSANTDSLAGGLDDHLASWVRDNLDDQLPAIVVSYDEATNRAVIRPLVMVGTTDGSKKARATVSNIPVFRFGGGGFFMRQPVKAGDFGWLKACDRDISLVLQRGGQQDWPNTKRRHNFSDAMFYPDTIKGWVVAGEDADAMTLQSLDGASVVSIAASKIEVRQGATITKTEASGITWTAGGHVMTMTAAGLFFDGKRIDGLHTHTGVTAGPSNTGPVT